MLQMLQMLTLDIVRTHDITIIPAIEQIPLNKDNYILWKNRQPRIM